jgi:hypothetical protein
VKKYKFIYGNGRLFDEKQAIVEAERFMEGVRDKSIGKPGDIFHLYLEAELWRVYADAKKGNSKGEHIKEFTV